MLQLTDDSLLWARSSSQGRIASHMEQALNEHWSYMGIRRCWNNHNYIIYHHSTNRNHQLKVFSPSVSFIHIYSTSHLSYVTTPMTQVETSCTVYLKGSTPKCSTLDSSTHGERHHKSGMWTMMNNPASNWARPQWMANYWAQKLSTKVHDIIKTHLSVVHILSPLFPFSWMKLWHIASWQLHRIVSPRLLIINEGVPRGGAIRNGDFQWQYIRQTASSFDFAVGSVCLAFLGSHSLMCGMSLNPVVSLL